MRKKNITTLLILIVIIIVVVVGGFALLRKPAKVTDVDLSSSTGHTDIKSSGPVINNAIVITKMDSTIGEYLAEPNGSPLYTYTGDTNSVSNCSGACLSAWPAYVDSGVTKSLPNNVGTLTRTDDGAVQFTYKGLPLYTFSGDSGGQVTGNGESGFSVAKP